MLYRDEKLTFRACSLFVRKRHEDEDEADDEPAQKKLKSDAETYLESRCQAPAVRTTEVSAADIASSGACHWLPGKVSANGKSNPPISAEGFLTESESLPEVPTCSMDFEEVEESVPEDCQKNRPKLFLTESASARLTEVLNLESDLTETTREANDMYRLKDRSKEPNCVVDPISKMETQPEEPEKMPELYYYM